MTNKIDLKSGGLNPMQMKFDVTEKIIEDAKKKIFEKVNSLKKQEPLFNDKTIDALINQAKEFSEKYQDNVSGEYLKIESFKKNQNKILLGVSQKDKAFLLDFFDRKTAYYESERTFHFLYGVKKGLDIYFILMDIIQGEITSKDFTKFFDSKYWDVDVFEIYISRYGKKYRLDELIKTVECILDSANISDNEYSILSDYLLDVDYIACEAKSLFEHGLSLGLKLAYKITNCNAV